MSRKGKTGTGSKNKIRVHRVFSDTFRRQRVKEIDEGLVSVSEQAKLYSISRASIYKWLYKYSPNHQKGVTQVVQMESEAQKTQALLKRLAELERIVGQKQLQLDYLEKLVEISSKELKIDLKKKFRHQVLSYFHGFIKQRGFKMNPYYQIAGVSKQAHQQYMHRLANKVDRTAYYIGLMEQARSMHPVIGLAKIYALYKPQGIGRTAFERVGKLAGYALDSRPMVSWKGARIIPYQNLLSGKWLTGVNQVWATDLTYYKIGQTYYYISMIMDLYSRKIIVCGLAQSLHAKYSLRLLKKAIKIRPLVHEHQLIHHSDKGSQYTCHDYIKCLKKHQIQISMCKSVYENTHMERLNGIIKNDYLIHWEPKSFKQLARLLTRAVTNYNNCPHGQLNMRSPIQYEESLKNVPLSQRTKMKVFTFNKPNNWTNPNQLELFKTSLTVNQKGQLNLG